ncbi:MAG: DegT/DnrJ/EryC1/StrS family aminotransferase [Planctomycetota bacterium]|jgi:dTDP-4-amino-4,6-dideoxygalactose transaminase
MKVQFLDLQAQYRSIQQEIHEALQAVMDRTAFAGGPFVEHFESEFASFCQCSFAVGCGSGTSALYLALHGLGIGEGDEVITAANTFIATAEAISACGAAPVFVDIDEQTYNMDPALFEAAITPKTKAIIPVHLYGQMAQMDSIMDIARAHDLYVIEDACQAHGAEYNRKRAGSIGDAGCFSFYPGKNLGAYGEGGAVVTNNSELAETMRTYRDHGQKKKYYHSMIGWNDRMDGLQGAVLSVKLKHLPEWNEARRENAQLYNKLLSNMDCVVTPVEADAAKHVYHIYAIRVQERDAVMKALAEKDIHCGIHYPVPIHLQNAYRFLGYEKNSLPVAERCVGELLSLPMFAELSQDQIEHVCEQIKAIHEVAV